MPLVTFSAAVALMAFVLQVTGQAEPIRTNADSTVGAVSDGRMIIGQVLEHAKADIETGKPQEAVVDLQQALALAPDNEELSFTLGAALIRSKRYREALPILKRLEAKYPDHSGVKNNLAWVYVKATEPGLRDIKKGLKYAQSAAVTAPDDEDAWETLAEAHYEAGEYEEALRSARIAVDLAARSKSTDTWLYWDLFRRCDQAISGKGKTGVGMKAVPAKPVLPKPTESGGESSRSELQDSGGAAPASPPWTSGNDSATERMK